VVRWNRALAARGRCLLPADVLGAEGLTPEAAIAEPGSPGVRRVLPRLAAEGRAFLGPRRRVPRGLVAAALPAVLARRDLGRGADAISGPRGLGDRLAVVVAGTIGWV